jgi:hypothetical protein
MSTSALADRPTPLGAILHAAEADPPRAGKAPWPVWNNSTCKPVEFQPLTRREAVRIYHDARRFERQTREADHQDGALGRNGLAVLYALLFDFLNHRTGRLDPTRATLANAANMCVRSVDKGLAKLKEAGVLNWIRRCAETCKDGVFWMRQLSSAYFVLPQGQWRGFTPAYEPCPAPDPESWGATPPLPEPMAMALALRAEGASVQAQIAALSCDPHDALANSMARWFAAVNARNA